MSGNKTIRNSLLTAALMVIGMGAGILLTSNLHWTTSVTAQDIAPPVNVAYPAQAVPLITESGESPFVAVAERVAKTVVNVTSDRKVERMSADEFFKDTPLWEFFHWNVPRRDREYIVPSTGSGIIIGREGYILTNNHVVEEAERLTVKAHDGEEYDAVIIGTDPETDVAVIKVDHTFSGEEVALPGNSDEIKIGDWAIAMGNPLGLDWTLTVGVISATGRTNLAIAGGGPSYQNFIQTDASINYGNSGGPLCNIHGEVIGVNSAINPSGQGIGFAIPINMAMKVVDQLRESGKVARGYLGMLPRELTSDLRSAVGLEDGRTGVFVERVDDATPADKGGLEAGDVIVEFAGKKIADVTQFRLLVADQPPGSPVSAKVVRDGKEKKLSFVLGDRSELVGLFGQSGEPEPAAESWLGVEVENISSDVAKALGLEEVSGVIVTEVDPDGPASRKLKERDVIIEIDRLEVANLSDFKRIAEKYKDTRKALLFRVIRNGSKTFEAIEP